MPAVGIHPEHPALLRGGEQCFRQLQGQFVGGDLVAEVGALRGRLAVLAEDHPLQIWPVLANAHIDRPAVFIVEQDDRVDAAGVDTLEVDTDQLLQTAGTGDRVRHAVLATEVEVVQPVGPLFVAGRDLVEFVLHRRGEVVVDQPAEVLLEQSGDGERHPRRNQRAALLVDITTVLNGLDDRRIR